MGTQKKMSLIPYPNPKYQDLMPNPNSYHNSDLSDSHTLETRQKKKSENLCRVLERPRRVALGAGTCGYKWNHI